MSIATMRAAVTTEWNQMAVQELAVPEPEPGQVRIRTILAGICGSDLHIFQGHHPTARSPIVQGHEFIGVLDAVGPDTSVEAKEGGRVVVEPLISCGRCEACRQGHVHVCRQLKLLGVHEDGAFAERFLAPATKVIAVPDALPDRLAVLTEPFAVGVHVCRRASMPPAMRALVVGAGPIGLIVAMAAASSGAEVVVSEVNDERLKLAESFGFAVIDGKADALDATLTLTDGDGFDVTFEVSGAPLGLALAIEATRARGTIVQVGFHSPPPTADLFKLALKELSIVGSRVYTHEDFRRSLRLLDRLARGAMFNPDRLISDQTGLAGIESAIGHMLAGKVAGKIIVDPTG